MSNVVNIRKLNIAQPVGNLSDIDSDLTKHVRAYINSKVREYVTAGGKINRLALKAGLTPATVSKLAYYETTRPMWRTIMSVIMALGCTEEFGMLLVNYARRHK